MIESNIFDKCKERFDSNGKPCFIGAARTEGHISLLYAYAKGPNEEERLLFCGIQDSGRLMPNQILGIRSQGEPDRYYRVQWPHRLGRNNLPVVWHRPEGDAISPQLVDNMKKAVRSNISSADLIAGYVPLDEKEAKKIRAVS